MVVLFLLLGVARPAMASSGGPEPWASVASQHGLDWRLLYGIALAESKMMAGGDGAERPWPWTVNSRLGPRRFSSRQETLDYVRYLIEQEGVENVDVGMMQINVRWNAHRTKYNLADLVDPEINIRVAAEILIEEWKRTGDLHSAVGRYHSPKEERARRYSSTVFGMLSRVKALYP